MRNLVLTYLVAACSLGGCGGPYVMERVATQDGMVTGYERIVVDGDGQVVSDRQEGYIPYNGNTGDDSWMY